MHDTGAGGNAKGAGHAPSFLQQIFSLGPLRFAILFALAFASAIWLVAGLLNGWWWQPPGLVNADGVHIGRDFIAFWSAAHLTLTGAPASAYDHAAMHGVQMETIGAPIRFTPWLYPPFVQQLLAPLAMLPYLAALVVWLLVPLAGLLLVVKRLVPHWSARAAVVLFPGTAQCLMVGQNGILTTLIIAAGLVHLERKPILAGVILGLLSYKPHIGATVYAALLFGGYWRTLGAAFGVTAALAGASILTIGTGPWLAFLEQSHYARTALESGVLPWHLMATAFAASRSAGADVYMSYAIQGAFALTAFAALFCVWRRNGPVGPRAAMLCAVIPLTTPYGYNYDLVVLLIPFFWLVQAGLQTGFRRSELAVLAATWVVPSVGWLIALSWHVLFTPLVLALFAATVLRRALGNEKLAIEKPVQLLDPQFFALQGARGPSRA